MEDAIRPGMSTETAERRCAGIASRQHGLLTRQQLLSTGLSPRSIGRRLTTGRLIVVHPGVYRVSGSPDSQEQRVLAACLWSDGVASHRTAAALWNLDGVVPVCLEITTPRRVRSQEVKAYRSHLPAGQVTKIGKIPVTTVARTLLDLGGVASASSLEAAVTDALRRNRTTLERLQSCLDEAGGKGRPGASALRSILQALGRQPAESVLELKLVRLLRRHGLPEPMRQFDIREGETLVARVDLAYPELRLAIEADGFSFHAGPGSWTRDLARSNALTALGWHVVHITWRDLTERPRQVIDQLRKVMGALMLGSGAATRGDSGSEQ
jgi:very-short-patch-repair endonuclease